MDYEKKYKEALEWIRDLYPTMEGAIREDAEHYFPELKESEDENIRTAILNHLKKMWGNANDDVCGIHVEDAIAWLEKQDKNHADKVEPRFHEGDWVACNTKYLPSPLRIVSISDTEYSVEDIQGVSVRPSIEHLDWHYHRWTINDAKDGDVLSWGDSKCIALFKNIYDKDSFSSYGFVGHYTGTFESRQSYHYIEEAHPATKEQRDFLFQKMNEAGYEWDADRKELCPLSKSEATSDSVTQTLVDTAKAFLQALSDTPYNNTPIVKAQFAVKQLLTFLSDPKAYNPDASNEHKSAEWSEEDEQLIDEVAVCLRKYEEKVQGGYSKFYVQSLADRIESLRLGNTCKATEWSEEDEAMFQGVIETEQYMLDVVYGRKNFSVGNESIKEECTKELSWLKSLKDRIK